jgi:MFS family permease
MSLKVIQVRSARTGLCALFIANTISFTGNTLAFIAIPWFVLQTTGSATQTGISAFFQMLPVVLAGFIGGNIVDRLGFKFTSVMADSASGVTIALIPLLYVTFGLEFWQLLVLVFVGNILDAPGNTARHALLPELARAGNVRLETVTTAAGIVERGARLIGAPLAGFLVVVVGASQVLWFDVMTFLISALLVGFFVPKVHLEPDKEEKAGSFSRFTAGFRYIWREPLVRLIVVLIMVANFLDAAHNSVILPVYVSRYYNNPLNFGLIIAVMGGGAVAGALLFGVLGQKVSRRVIFMGGILIMGIARLAYVVVPPFWVLLLSAVITGLAAGPINPIMDAVLLARIPARLRGRVLGAIWAGVSVLAPLGVLSVGFILDRFDMRFIILGMGIIYIVATLLALFSPTSRDLNTKGEFQKGQEREAQVIQP